MILSLPHSKLLFFFGAFWKVAGSLNTDVMPGCGRKTGKQHTEGEGGPELCKVDLRVI